MKFHLVVFAVFTLLSAAPLSASSPEEKLIKEILRLLPKEYQQALKGQIVVVPDLSRFELAKTINALDKELLKTKAAFILSQPGQSPALPVYINGQSPIWQGALELYHRYGVAYSPFTVFLAALVGEHEYRGHVLENKSEAAALQLELDFVLRAEKEGKFNPHLRQPCGVKEYIALLRRQLAEEQKIAARVPD